MKRLIFLSAIFFFCLASCAGKEEVTEEATLSQGNAAHGQEIYQLRCSDCHGTGKGDGKLAAVLNPKPADHTNKATMAKLSDKEIFNIIKMGGGIVGKPTMPAHPMLSDGDVHDIVAHIRQISGS